MISEFKAGAKICQSVLMRVQRVGTSSNGAPFARGLLEDNSGKIPLPAAYWRTTAAKYRLLLLKLRLLKNCAIWTALRR